MIFINLLPEEFREKKIQIPVPLRGISWVLAAVFVVLWVIFSILQGACARQVAKVEADYQAMAPRLHEAQALLTRMNEEILPKMNFLERLDQPETQWDQILNMISDAVPENIWFESLELTVDPSFSTRIEGLARSASDRPSMESIGSFVTALKKDLEIFVGQNAAPPPQLLTETFTQQEELEHMKVTKFMVEFKKS